MALAGVHRARSPRGATSGRRAAPAPRRRAPRSRAAGVGGRSRPVDDLVGGADVPVQRVRGRAARRRAAGASPSSTSDRAAAAACRHDSYAALILGSMTRIVILVTHDGSTPARPAAALRDRQGWRRQDHGRRFARSRGRRGGPPDHRLRGRRAGPRVARAGPRGRGGGDRGRAGREPVGDHDRPAARARGVARAPDRRRRTAGARALVGVRLLRGRRARRQGADHDRQGVGAGPERALGPPQPHLRPRGGRRARLRPRPGHAHHAAHVRRDRARRADPPPGDEGARHAGRPRADRLPGGRAAGGDARQRDARARAAAAGGGRRGPGGDRRQRHVAGALQRRRRRGDARGRRRPARTCGPR